MTGLIGPWCNGSTRDFGSLCLGSNPDGPTNAKTPHCCGVFLFSLVFFHPIQLPGTLGRSSPHKRKWTRGCPPRSRFQVARCHCSTAPSNRRSSPRVNQRGGGLATRWGRRLHRSVDRPRVVNHAIMAWLTTLTTLCPEAKSPHLDGACEPQLLTGLEFWPDAPDEFQVPGLPERNPPIHRCHSHRPLLIHLSSE